MKSLGSSGALKPSGSLLTPIRLRRRYAAKRYQRAQVETQALRPLPNEKRGDPALSDQGSGRGAQRDETCDLRGNAGERLPVISTNCRFR
jgi:hypothetical protein